MWGDRSFTRIIQKKLGESKRHCQRKEPASLETKKLEIWILMVATCKNVVVRYTMKRES